MSDHPCHTDAAREALSALIDGQARPDELSEILSAWKTDAGTRQVWRDYQFVGDVMRSAELARGTDSDRFLLNLRSRLAEEPVVLAPAAARAVAHESVMAPVSAPVSAQAGAPLGARPRHWFGPVAVAAGFVMVVGAMVSALAPVSQVPAEALASAEPRIHLATSDADPAMGVTAAVPVVSALVSADALAPAPLAWQAAPDVGGSFSRPARASAVLIRDPRLDQGLAARRLAVQQEASFAVPHELTQHVVFESP